MFDLNIICERSLSKLSENQKLTLDQPTEVLVVEKLWLLKNVFV